MISATSIHLPPAKFGTRLPYTVTPRGLKIFGKLFILTEMLYFSVWKKTENFHACMHIRHSSVMHLRYFHSNSTSQLWYTASSGHCPNFEFWPKYRIFEFVINTLTSYLWSYRREIYQFCICGCVLIICFLPYILVFVACKSIETLFKKPPARKKLAPNLFSTKWEQIIKEGRPLRCPTLHPPAIKKGRTRLL